MLGLSDGRRWVFNNSPGYFDQWKVPYLPRGFTSSPRMTFKHRLAIERYLPGRVLHYDC
jgi:hypothetical protein